MKKLNLKDVTKYVQDNIGTFHEKRIKRLETLSLTDVLKRKNPYLFKAKNALTAQEIVKGIVDAHISSAEEGIFGDWLEGLAIFINKQVFGGDKSGIVGVDLEFSYKGNRFIVNIKSGPNWGNSSQISKMVLDFKRAKRTLRTSGSKLNVIAVNGCCYGKDNNPDKGYYFKYCGQAFWDFISGNQDLYIEIIKPLGHKAKQKNAKFLSVYSNLINRFTTEFGNVYCKKSGAIDWDKLVQFNSGV